MLLYLYLDESKFKSYYIDDIFIDKSMIIKECNHYIRKPNKFMCLTRPRRFGKNYGLIYA